MLFGYVLGFCTWFRVKIIVMYLVLVRGLGVRVIYLILLLLRVVYSNFYLYLIFNVRFVVLGLKLGLCTWVFVVVGCYLFSCTWFFSVSYFVLNLCTRFGVKIMYSFFLYLIFVLDLLYLVVVLSLGVDLCT